MSYRKVLISVVSVLGVAGVGGLAVALQDTRQALPAEAGDLREAAAVEVREAGGQVVLSGAFGAADTDDDDGDVERKADLKAASGAAKGEAEIETTGAAGMLRQDFEIEVEGLAAGAAFTVWVDGRQVATLTTDNRGKAEAELTNAGTK